MMRMMLDGGFTSPETALGSPGHDGLKWIKPVYPGDSVEGTVQVETVRISRSRAENGLVTAIARLFDQEGQEVYWLKCTSIVKTRQSAST